MSEWISVKDKLPEDGRPVLTCDGRSIMDVMSRDNAIQGWKYNDAIFYDDVFKNMEAGIKAWQPLPEPYREET